MRMYLDCEFNGYGGELISLALVAEDHSWFYREFEIKDPVDPWVAQHVMPHIDSYSDYVHGQESLAEWLARWQRIHVVADWPADISYFCEFLITGPGTRIDTPKLTMEVRRDIDSSKSETPHYALADARALMDAALAREE